MPDTAYHSKEEVLAAAERAVHKSVRSFIPEEDMSHIEAELVRLGTGRKGYLGNLIEKYVFGVASNSRPEPDLMPVGIELKSTPVRTHKTKGYAAKERLVFSMIDYDAVVSEQWETSSFLKKNSMLLIMFYLYLDRQSILDHELKFAHLLNLLEDISEQDAEQIRKDWQFIVDKVSRGKAHLLSEGDTFYLGASTKAANSKVVRDQPMSREPAKPRAFSLKQSYLNYLIQTKLLGIESAAESLYKGVRADKTIEEVVEDKLAPYVGMPISRIMDRMGWHPKKKPKNLNRLIVNRMLTGSGSNSIAEFEKANVTLRVISLEPSGRLKESVSFTAFDYKDLPTQIWYDEEAEVMADFRADIEMNRFLFVVFQKNTSGEAVLSRWKFWTFPPEDIDEAELVFDKTVACINEGRYKDLPRMSQGEVAHVRPHGRIGADTQETPQGTQETKKGFWLNAKYVQRIIADV